MLVHAVQSFLNAVGVFGRVGRSLPSYSGGCAAGFVSLDGGGNTYIRIKFSEFFSEFQEKYFSEICM